MFSSMFSTPFDLKYYVITIEDTSVYKGPKGWLGYNIYLDGEQLKFLKAEGKTKTTILANKRHELKTELKFSQGDAPSGSMVSFTVDFKVLIKPSLLDVFAKIFLILVALQGLFL